MKQLSRRKALLIILLYGLPLFFVGIRAAAQVGSTYDLTWSTFDGGSGVSTGGQYSVGGTLGQSDGSASAALTGGSYELTGGFWLPGMGAPTAIGLQGSDARTGAGPGPALVLALFGLSLLGFIWVRRHHAAR